MLEEQFAAGDRIGVARFFEFEIRILAAPVRGLTLRSGGCGSLRTGLGAFCHLNLSLGAAEYHIAREGPARLRRYGFGWIPPKNERQCAANSSAIGLIARLASVARTSRLPLTGLLNGRAIRARPS